MSNSVPPSPYVWRHPVFTTAVRGESASVVGPEGRRIQYEILGHGEPTLVLIHGGLCDRSYWADQAVRLATTHRVLSIDLPGHGGSDAAPYWSIEGCGGDVVRAIEAAAAVRVVLVGHSLGAIVAIEAARQLGDSALGVIVVDMLHQPSARPPPPPQLPLEAIKAAMRQGMFKPASDPALQTKIIDAMTSAPRDVAAGARGAMNAYDAADGLKAMGRRRLAMIFSGMRPVAADEIRSLHPGVRIYSLPGAGHFLMFDAPDACEAILRLEALTMSGELVTA